MKFDPPLNADEQKLLDALREHNMDYECSFDPAVWKSGRASHNRVCLLMLNVTRGRAAMLWNYVASERGKQDFMSGLPPE